MQSPSSVSEHVVVGENLRATLRRYPTGRWIGMLPVLLLAAWWWWASYRGILAHQLLPPPGDVVGAAFDLLTNGDLATALSASLWRVGLGVALGVSMGTVLGLLSGMFRIGERLLDPALQMVRTMPSLALVPLFVIWFGIGEMSKVLLIAIGITFPVYVNLYAGIRGIDQRLVEAGDVFGMGRWERIRDVVLPGALASWLVGLRYAIGIAWIILVAAEQINASSGLGMLMNDAQNLLQTEVILVCLTVYSLLGLLTDLGVRQLERRLLSWRRGFEAR